MERLIEQVLAGKRGAIRELYAKYAPGLRQYLRGRLKEEEDVEELLQDTFMSALDSLPLYRGTASFRTWLTSIARHEVSDWYRKRYVRQAVEKTAPLFEEMLPLMRGPEWELKKKMVKQKFRKSYQGLKQEYQDALSYRYELGMSVKEIAAKMNLSFKATESLLFRARAAFRLAYEE